ncbi:hypothetical protein ACTFIV_007880, partial [Dictyostelium citrinum]
DARSVNGLSGTIQESQQLQAGDSNLQNNNPLVLLSPLSTNPKSVNSTQDKHEKLCESPSGFTAKYLTKYPSATTLKSPLGIPLRATINSKVGISLTTDFCKMTCEAEQHRHEEQSQPILLLMVKFFSVVLKQYCLWVLFNEMSFWLLGYSSLKPTIIESFKYEFTDTLSSQH